MIKYEIKRCLESDFSYHGLKENEIDLISEEIIRFSGIYFEKAHLDLQVNKDSLFNGLQSLLMGNVLKGEYIGHCNICHNTDIYFSLKCKEDKEKFKCYNCGEVGVTELVEMLRKYSE